MLYVLYTHDPRSYMDLDIIATVSPKEKSFATVTAVYRQFALLNCRCFTYLSCWTTPPSLQSSAAASFLFALLLPSDNCSIELYNYTYNYTSNSTIRRQDVSNCKSKCIIGRPRVQLYVQLYVQYVQLYTIDCTIVLSVNTFWAHLRWSVHA